MLAETLDLYHILADLSDTKRTTFWLRLRYPNADEIVKLLGQKKWIVGPFESPAGELRISEAGRLALDERRRLLEHSDTPTSVVTNVGSIAIGTNARSKGTVTHHSTSLSESEAALLRELVVLLQHIEGSLDEDAQEEWDEAIVVISAQAASPDAPVPGYRNALRAVLRLASRFSESAAANAAGTIAAVAIVEHLL